MADYPGYWLDPRRASMAQAISGSPLIDLYNLPSTPEYTEEENKLFRERGLLPEMKDLRAHGYTPFGLPPLFPPQQLEDQRNRRFDVLPMAENSTEDQRDRGEFEKLFRSMFVRPDLSHLPAKHSALGVLAGLWDIPSAPNPRIRGPR